MGTLLHFLLCNSIIRRSICRWELSSLDERCRPGKKVAERNARELASRRVLRHQKKPVEKCAKKVTELITSSTKKKKVVGTLSKDIADPVAGRKLDANFRTVDFSDCSEGDGAISNCVADTIFSPSFHIPINIGEETPSVVWNQEFQDCGKANTQNDCPGIGALPPKVSAINLSMRNPNLECVDENYQDHMSANVCQEDEDGEDYDDFDPYLFIKNLPDLSSVVPMFRPVLLPKQTRSCPSTTLVLDLDETLVHSTLETVADADFTFSVNFNLTDHTVYVRCLPHLRGFLERVSRLFEIIIFTASQSIYAHQLHNILDPKKKIFRHRVYRESCVLIDGNYLKDRSVLGRDLARVIIIDNSPQAFGFQVDNGIPIESWFEDRCDTELLLLLPFLEILVGVEDVRPLITKNYNLREKIAAAICHMDYNEGDPFEMSTYSVCLNCLLSLHLRHHLLG